MRTNQGPELSPRACLGLFRNILKAQRDVQHRPGIALNIRQGRSLPL
ncbi:hypothetical protein E2C01_074600 [Portunus trituberculatus]|uniref:Uncharacterized protein n=1 Tax=Portunus trituberculatus TaxID=210409 RepID=A0A5B7IEQ0_PORTR|nr:hypothetical protein [Portunus trituberculatus]